MEASMKVYCAVLLSALSTAGCVAQSSQSPEQIKLNHIDVTLVDSAVSPCDNFYQYACGKLMTEPIPSDQVSWGADSKLAMWNRQVLLRILEKNEAANASCSPNEQKIGDLYATCMDQESSGGNDLQVIQPLLTQIQGIQNKREIAEVLAAIHSSFGRAWEAGDNQTNVAMFGYGPQPDYNDVSRVVAGIDQGGLGMPGRDFYLSDDAEMKAVREKYVALITTLLKMDGMSDADAMKSASTILRIETAMAQAQMDNISRRDPNKTNNRYTLGEASGIGAGF
jgi:putative endopeptidase